MMDQTPVLGRGLQMSQAEALRHPKSLTQGSLADPGSGDRRLWHVPAFLPASGEMGLLAPAQPHAVVASVLAQPGASVRHHPSGRPESSLGSILAFGGQAPSTELLGGACAAGRDQASSAPPGQIPVGAVGCIPRLVGSAGETPAAPGPGVLFRLLGQVSPPRCSSDTPRR